MTDEHQSNTPHMGAGHTAAAQTASGFPYRQIRAVYDDATIRVYQAFNDQIADAALAAGRFVAPFSRSRMTWIKPSFRWMMYRAGWGRKDDNQRRILAIDLRREGFEWALANSCPSHPDPAMTPQQWQQHRDATPVRIQWDPERDLHFHPLDHRSIQIGLGRPAVLRYVEEWIQRIEDITPLAHRMHALVQADRLEEAAALLPPERPYLPQTEV